MKLAFSNIAWDVKDNETMYTLLRKYGFSGLEIAPTKLFGASPYTRCKEAEDFSRRLFGDFGLTACSMQSIWYGRGEKMFPSEHERKFLLEYTKSAILFAEAAGISNIVFGCPGSRSVFSEGDREEAFLFFKELADFAHLHNTVIGMEANPAIYNTNYINTTRDAIDLVLRVNSPGFKLNLDIGTMINNGETVDMLRGCVKYINHVHISEPHLRPIEERELHRELFDLLRSEDYIGYVSIEMGSCDSIPTMEAAMKYISSLIAAKGAVTVGRQEGVPKYECMEFDERRSDYVVLIPIINEGERIIKELKSAMEHGIHKHADIVICDGGSKDGSTDPELLRSLCVNTLLTKRDVGKQGAQLRMGFSWALDRGYLGIITIDGNNKDSIEDVPRFIEKLRCGYDFVQGSRFIKGGRAVNTPLIRYLSVRLLHAPIISLTAGKWFTDTTNAYRAYSRKYLTHEGVQPLRDIFMTYELLAYLSVRATQLKMNACEIPVRREYPKVGKTPTKISFFKGNNQLLKILFKNLFGAYKPRGEKH